MVYLDRLQRAIDYIETHLEDEIVLEDVAGVACYSPSHFIWIFKTTVGTTPMEYVRKRKLTEAAAAILNGSDIVDTVYRFGFSAQDVFTRSFKSAYGLPPGKYRSSGGLFGAFTPALKLHSNGGSMISYNMDCDDVKSMMRIEQLLRAS